LLEELTIGATQSPQPLRGFQGGVGCIGVIEVGNQHVQPLQKQASENRLLKYR